MDTKGTKSTDWWIWLLCVLILVTCYFSYSWIDSRYLNYKPSVNSSKKDPSDFWSYENRLSEYSTEVRVNVLEPYVSKDIAESIAKSSSLPEMVYKVAKLVDPKASMSEINEFLNLCIKEIKSYRWTDKKVSFDKLQVKEKLEVIATYLLEDKNFIYGSSILDHDPEVKGSDGKTKIKDETKGDTEPAPYSVHNLIKTGIGNCATMPVVYTMLAQRLGLNVKLVGIKDHMFARYEDSDLRINIETTSPNGMGVGTPDSFYLDLLKPSRKMLKNSTCLKSLSLKESAGALFITQMAYLSKSGASSEAIKRSVAYSLYFNERSEHAVANSLKIFTNEKSTEDTLRDYLLSRARYLGAAAPDPKTIKSIETKLTGLQRTAGSLASKIKKVRHERSNRFLNQGQRTLNNINKRQEIYNQINKTNDPIKSQKLQKELRDLSYGDQVKDQRELTETIHSLLRDIDYNSKMLEEFVREFSEDFEFEHLEIINQLTIQNGHNRSEVIGLNKF